MKSIKHSLFSVFLLMSLTGLSQTIKNYEREWKKVDEYVKKNLPASALAEVKKIYELAKKETQEAQIIKSLIYTVGLQQQTREEGEITGEFNSEGREGANHKEITVNTNTAAHTYTLVFDVNVVASAQQQTPAN